jgi:hypothetical protein
MNLRAKTVASGSPEASPMIMVIFCSLNLCSDQCVQLDALVILTLFYTPARGTSAASQPRPRWPV